MRGWIPPDDRLWRHPSEAGGAPAGRITAPPGRAAPIMLAGVTVGLVFVLLTAGIVVATSTADRGPAPTTATFTGVPTTQAGTPPAVASRMTSAATALLPSTVALIVVRNGGTVEGTGVVAEAGGIIATLCSLVDGARSITAVEPDGARRPATLLATDPTSGIAVVRIDDDLPAATFAAGDPAPGSLAWALSERVAAGTAPLSARLYGGTVTASGRAQGTGTVAAFASTAVATPLSAADIGCPLVDRAGTVVGVLDQVVVTPRGVESVFLPAQLVRVVADQLVAGGTIVQGALGAAAVDAPGTDGAVLATIDPDGAAAVSGLAAGDVVTSVNGAPVHSAAELRTRLYAQPPGTQVVVGFVRAGATSTVDVVLE